MTTDNDWPFGDDESDIDLALAVEDLTALEEHSKRVIPVAPPWWAVFGEIDEERHRQNAKWGEQHHPDGTGHLYFAEEAKEMKRQNDARALAGNLVWSKILLEEVYEALAEKDVKRLAYELVQCAAVCVAWLQDIAGRQDDATSTPAA